MSEAVASRGFAIIPESDVQTAFAGHGQVTPRSDPIAAARLVASQFGAGAVLLGTVTRYREREGSAYGSMAPASVDFEVTLYEAPSGRRIWRGQFEQTQQTATANFFTSVRYPKGGTRFLSVAELTRWGAELLANALPLRRI